MKKILEIFKQDVSAILHNRFAVIIVLGILIIPGIYAWLNIDSNWEPYSNTGNIPIAVVNKDTGTTVLGEKINLGDEIEDALKDNDAMKWTFTDEEDAKERVERSDYYGAIVIPENFSSKINTITDGEIQKPTFDFYVNNKKNPIAPIIVNKAVSTVQQSVNQAFVKTIVSRGMEVASNLDIMKKGTVVADGAVVKLENSKERIGQIRTVLSTADLATDTATNSLKAIKELLPTISNVTKATKQDVNEIRGIATTFENTYAGIDSRISSILDSAEALNNDILSTLDAVSSGDITKHLEDISERLDELENKLIELSEFIDTLENIAQIPGLDTLKTKIDDLITRIEGIKQIYTNSITIIADLNGAKKQVQKISDELRALRSEYQNQIKPALNDLYKTTSKVIGRTADTILNLNSSFDNMDSSIGYMVQSLESGGKLTREIDVVLADLQTDIDGIIQLIKELKNSDLFTVVASVMDNDPDDVADFLSTLVDSNEIQIYPVESYGSEMAPFYSVLACWVGCTILSAILKIDVKKTKLTKDAKRYQIFFGRFMLFGVLASLQGLAIGIGDIIMQVQTTNWFLFLFTLMLSSAVFSMIIYSLVFVFGKVGQALSIVLLVLQVAGSGGTFPIELLPRPFQVLQPFMPFYPALNATRETIAGFYQNDYLVYIMILLCHIIIPIILGLVLSIYTEGPRRRIAGGLHDTGVIG